MLQFLPLGDVTEGTDFKSVILEITMHFGIWIALGNNQSIVGQMIWFLEIVKANQLIILARRSRQF